MSQFSCPVIRIPKVGKHPNADSLSIVTVEGCPVIFRTGDFQQGDAAIYVPVEAVVPKTVPGTEFLGDKRRIRAIRLRGIFSMGLLLPVSVLGAHAFVGEDVSTRLGITKWEEPEEVTMRDDQAPAPKANVPVYDVESWRKYGPFEGDPVVEVSEKLHGTNSRAVWVDGLHVGSHKTWKAESESNLWWRMARQYNLKEKLAKYPGLVFYYETYGANVQDLPYGHPKGKQSIAVFDIFDSGYAEVVRPGKWLSVDEVDDICGFLDLPRVPVLFRGLQSEILPKLEELSKGKSTVAPDQIKEGIVIKTVDPGYDIRYGRTILKLVGEDYMLRGGNRTERH